LLHGGHRFGVVTSDNVTHHHQIRGRFEVPGPIPFLDLNVSGGKEGAHGRVDIFV
jgi:hypothetical protein